MKRLITTICVCLISASVITGCNKNKYSTPTTESTESVTEKDAKKVTKKVTEKKSTKKTDETSSKSEETTKKLTIDDVTDEMLQDFYEDSVFIGDSRTEGLLLYTDLSTYSTFYSKVGLNITSATTKAFVKLGDKEVTILEAMKKNKFTKIYIMLGFNELNWPNDYVFFDKYASFIEELQKLQPDATIYLESILHVTSKHSKEDPCEKNSRINEFNKKIKAMQNGKNIKYININPCYDDKHKALKAETTTDGIHLKAQYYDTWMKYLVLHP